MQPIFLYSLPRAGSTLVQRILGAHADIATASEPWLLLPLLYSLRGKGAYAEYDHGLAASAIEDFCKLLPKGREDYEGELRETAMRLYRGAARRDARYFLDKTPRYHLIANELIRIFPAGKHVFLWRSPLATLGSFIGYFGQGTWNLYGYRVDLFTGLENLTGAYGQAKGTTHALRYEDLITNRDATLEKLFAYLELPFDKKAAESFSQVKLEGRMGDRAGTQAYTQISSEPLDKWKKALANPLRKRWARRYLHWIGSERLSLMGYSLDGLLGELDAAPTSAEHLCSDMVRMTYGYIETARGRNWQCGR